MLGFNNQERVIADNVTNNMLVIKRSKHNQYKMLQEINFTDSWDPVMGQSHGSMGWWTVVCLLYQ